MQLATACSICSPTSQWKLVESMNSSLGHQLTQRSVLHMQRLQTSIHYSAYSSSQKSAEMDYGVKRQKPHCWEWSIKDSVDIESEHLQCGSALVLELPIKLPMGEVTRNNKQ